MLLLDIQIELFDRLILPILLYGCEVWCPMMTKLASKLQLRFYKIILKLSKSTPSCMVNLDSFRLGSRQSVGCKIFDLKW